MFLCRNNLEKMERDLTNFRIEFVELLEQNRDLEANEVNAKSIQSDIIKIDSYINDVRRYQKEELHLAKEMNESGFNRSLQEAITEQKALKSTVNNICNVLEENQNKLNTYNETLHELQAQLSKIKNDELSIQIKMQDEKTILDKLNELQNLEATIRFELDSAREDIKPIQKNLEMSINNLNKTKEQHNKIIENNRREVMFLIN